MTRNREERRSQLKKLLAEDTFRTDQQLAEEFGVSVATIRLDRMALGIPELRERTKQMATINHHKLKALEGHEVIGELVDLQIEDHAISLLSVVDDMTFTRTKILRGHFLFAQANSLAVALVDAEVALTLRAEVLYLQPVKVSQRVIAKADLVEKVGSRHTITVNSTVNQEVVFKGEFVVVALDGKEGDSN